MSALQPLTVLYTGTRAPISLFEDITVVHLPMLQTRFLTPDREHIQTLRRCLQSPSAIVVYSQYGVESVHATGLLDDINLKDHQFWAVGDKTAQRLLEYFKVIAQVPPKQHFMNLVEVMHASEVPDTIISFTLLDGPRSLKDSVLARTDRVILDIPVYETTTKCYDDLLGLVAQTVPDWLVFTSPRGVTAFDQQMRHVTTLQESLFQWKNIPCAAIGPTTEKALRATGVMPQLVMTKPDRTELIKAIAAQKQSHN